MLHPIYVAWQNMMHRCENNSDKDWEHYGGRGITVCPEWKSLSTFWRDMGPSWRKGLWLDRIDNDKGYKPENCRWVTRSQSAYNRRTFRNNSSGISGVGLVGNLFRARAGKGGEILLYQGSDFFEACCARKSWESKWLLRGAV